VRASRTQSGPLVLLRDQDAAAATAAAGDGDASDSCIPEGHVQLLSPLPTTKHISIARRFVRQLSSPVPVKGAAQVRTLATVPPCVRALRSNRLLRRQP
jgi:hypothetical protein